MANFSTIHSFAGPAPAKDLALQPSSGDAGILLAAALVGSLSARAAKKQYRKALRKAAWQALRNRVLSLFSGKKRRDTIFGLEAWLFFVLVLVAAALGVALFGFWGFLVLVALGVIIYLLLKQSS
jgi:fatty acid desaturase